MTIQHVVSSNSHVSVNTDHILGKVTILRTVAVKRICNVFSEDHYTKTLIIIAAHNIQSLLDGKSEQILKALCC